VILKMDFETSNSLEESLCENCRHADDCKYASMVDDDAKCKTFASMEKLADDRFREIMKAIGEEIL